MELWSRLRRGLGNSDPIQTAPHFATPGIQLHLSLLLPQSLQNWKQTRPHPHPKTNPPPEGQGHPQRLHLDQATGDPDLPGKVPGVRSPR